MKSNKDETKMTESSSSGPNTSSIQSYDKPTFSTTSLTSSNYSAPSSNNSNGSNYKHYSSISTTKSSPVDKFVKKAEFDESTKVSKEEDITPYKAFSYSASTTAAASVISSGSTTAPPKTVSVKTNGSKTSTTVTNNFKLPPFPVYVPSTSLPSVTHHTSESGLNSKSETSTAAFSSKYSDSPSSSSVTTAYSTTLNRLSNSSSPSRTITNVNTTNTLPLHLGRNNPYLYQSESNFNNPTVTNSNPSENYSSPVTSYSSQQSNYNNVYSTLPKTTGSSSFASKYDSANSDTDKLSTSYSSYKYSTDYYSNLSSTTSNSNATTSNGATSDNNMYRVQYSATNPFLDPLDPSPSNATTSGSDNISSLLRGSVSEAKKKFEKLDSEEDLK